MCIIYWLDTNWLFTFLFFAAIINAFVKTSVIWGRYPLTAACVQLLMDFCDFPPFNFCPVHLLDFCRLRDFQLLWLLPFWCVTIFLWHDWQGNRLWCAHLTPLQHCTPLAHIVRRKNLKTLMVKSEIDHITLGPRCLIQFVVAEGIFRRLHKTVCKHRKNCKCYPVSPCQPICTSPYRPYRRPSCGLLHCVCVIHHGWQKLPAFWGPQKIPQSFRTTRIWKEKMPCLYTFATKT